MGIEKLPSGFAGFLKEAKQNSYAGANDDPTVPNPCLEQSNQLEWRSGDWFYRDIYYGSSYFSGMETVYFLDKPVWSMVYSGGGFLNVAPQQIKRLYAFLQMALRKIPSDLPVRGCPSFVEKNFEYQMKSSGNLMAFSGEERVFSDQECQYSLTFAGGAIR